MSRLILLLSVIISVLIVVGSYFLSKRIYEVNDLAGEIVRDENTMKTTTQTSNRLEVTTNTDTVTENIKVEPNEAQISEEKEIPLAQGKRFEVSPSITQNVPKQGGHHTARIEEEPPLPGLSPEISKRVYELEKELMRNDVTPERAREIMALMNELTRPVRPQHVYSDPPVSDVKGELRFETPP